MSHLFADSGGSQTHWLLISKDASKSLETIGLNPNIVDAATRQTVLRSQVRTWLAEDAVEAVSFFGAGLADPISREQRRKELAEHLGRSCPIHVDTDLMGAAYAAFGNQPGIVGILGTGSAAIHFDGTTVIDRRGGFGFRMGDEGGGVALGKALLRLIINGNASPQLEQSYYHYAGLRPEELKKTIFKHPNLPRFLATQAPFLSRHSDDPQVTEILNTQFRFFLMNDVLPLYKKRQLKVVLSGGIARNFVYQLKSLAKELGIDALDILTEHPIKGLATFLHQ